MKRNNSYYLFILLITLCDTACSSDKAANKTIKPDYDIKLAPGCYQMTIGRDTALLQLDNTGEVMTGKLSYKPFEKDKNNGTFHATMKKDILRTWYTFQSEGKISVRQIYFKVIEGNLAEGYGDIDMRSDSIFLKHPANLNFETQHLYQKIDCK